MASPGPNASRFLVGRHSYTFRNRMGFGLTVIDDTGRIWTVDAIRCPHTQTILGLYFSRPSFLAPVEERYAEAAPSCWPNCTADDLRARLRMAAPLKS